MAGTPGLKFEEIGVRPGGRPKNLTLDSKLFQKLARLSQVTRHPRPGRSHRALIIDVSAVGPGFRKFPRRMVQDQAGEGKQPHEEEQKQSSVEMQLAIPSRAGGTMVASRSVMLIVATVSRPGIMTGMINVPSLTRCRRFLAVSWERPRTWLLSLRFLLQTTRNSCAAHPSSWTADAWESCSVAGRVIRASSLPSSP